VREDGTQREVGVDKVMVNQEGGKYSKGEDGKYTQRKILCRIK